MGRQKIEQKKGKEEVEFKDKGIQRNLSTCNKFHLICFRLACHQPCSLKTQALISPADSELSPWEKLVLSGRQCAGPCESHPPPFYKDPEQEHISEIR